MLQNLSGWTVGDTFLISFNYAGSNLFLGSSDVRIHLFIDGIDIAQTPAFSSTSTIWQNFNHWFIPSTPNHSIGVRTYTVNPFTDGSAAIDNISVYTCTSMVVNLGSDTTLCPSTSLTLDATWVYSTYLWQDGSTSATYTVDSPGTYWVRVMNPCDTISDTIVIAAAAPVTADFSAPFGCDGQPMSFTDLSTTTDSIVTWYWDFDGEGFSAQQNPVFIWPTWGLKTVTLTVTTDLGCMDTVSRFVMVYPPPPLATTADTMFCGPSLHQLTAFGSGTFEWSPGLTLNDSTIANPVASPTVTTTYTVTLTAANGCTNTDSVTVTVHFLPVVDAGPDQTICDGETTTLAATGALTYIWQPGNFSGPSINVSPPTTTIYSVTGVDANGCEGADTVTVTVNPLPTVIVQQVPPGALCEGQSVVLTAAGAIFYNWEPGALSGSSVTITPISTTVYTVTGTDANGCAGNDTITITVNPDPVVTISPDVSICAGANTPLTVSGGTQYYWDVGASGLSCYFCPNPVASPSATITYSVTVESAGCTKDTSVTVTVHPLPVVLVQQAPTGALCQGDTVMLAVTPVFATYLWSTGETTSGITDQPAVTTTYWITATDANGCEDSDSVTVTINPLPPVDAGADVTICKGASATLNAAGADTYTWEPGTLSGPVQSVAPTTTTIYTVTGADVNGCEATDSIIVAINSLPIVDAGPNHPICEGSSTAITATGAMTYTWEPGTQNGQTITVSPTTHTTYTVTGVDANGCTGVDSVTITIDPVPVVTISATDTQLCEGESATLTASGAFGYSWSPGGSGASINVTPTVTTGYLVTGIDANGCEDTATIIVTVQELPTVIITGDTDICEGESTTLTASGADSYGWPTNPLLVSPSATTTYSVTGTNISGCDDSTSITVVVHPLPLVDAGTDVNICDGDTVTLTANGANTYFWTPGGPGQSIVAAPSIATTYSVVGTDTWGCADDDDVTVSVFALPNVSAMPAIVCPGEPALLTATTDQAGLNYTWQPGSMTGDSIVVTPYSTTTYTVTGIDANGCEDTTVVTITVRNDCPQPGPVLEIPTAFSPNGDGLNDIFRIEHSENFTLTSIRVFNRWGQVVFETSDISSGWDGTYVGREQGIGAYAVVVAGVGDEGEPVMWKGNLTVIR
jgi:gliding motility-associated-like protein